MSKFKNKYKKTWKEFGRRPIPSYVSFTETWGDSGGKWTKRQLSKARRRYIKAILLGHLAKEPTGWESTVNWRSW